MFKNLKRNYKERKPEVTIENIKNILGKLDVATKITMSSKPMNEIFSHRVEIVAGDKGIFGANGKGLTEDYSLASAYAELMERVQNGFCTDFGKDFLDELKKEFGFYYFPDEVCLTEEEFRGLPPKVIKDCTKYSGEAQEMFIKDYFNRLKEAGLPGVVAIPFYDTKNREVINIPYNLLIVGAGSNGMAAGNTVTEAIFQGLCELMERWCASVVFFDQLTPPDVPDEFLQQFEKEYKLLKEIEALGYEVKVKDFSAKYDMPALGLMVFDWKENKYNLNVGCESNFSVALSRCITEIYQGCGNHKEFKGRFLDIPDGEIDCFKDESEKSIAERHRQFQKFTVDGSGNYPGSLFKKEVSYEFNAEVFTSEDSYDKEVDNYINKFHSKGYNVYTRDVSFLGFPSVLIYIPEVSFKGKKNTYVDNSRTSFPVVEVDRIRHLFLNLRKCSDEDLKTILNAVGEFNEISLYNLLSINLEETSSFKDMPMSFLSTLLYYKIREFDKAKKSFERYYESLEKKNSYYDLVKEYLNHKSENGRTSEEIEELVKKSAGEDVDTAKEVCEDLRNPEDILKNLLLPSCPDCDSCEISGECLTNRRFTVSRNLYGEMKKHNISQNSVN